MAPRWLPVRRRDPDKVRATWSWVQFLGVCSCFVGLQMVWSFPGYVAKHTVSSLVPFYAGYLIVVLPILYVQMRVGGSTRRNIVLLFADYCPILKGVGIACVIRLFLISVYFNVFIAYLMNLGLSALQTPFPWSQCHGNLTEEQCTSKPTNFYTSDAPSEVVYFQSGILEASGSISDEGSIPAHLGVALVIAWVITFICVMGGVRLFAWLMALLGGVATILAIAVLAYGREEIEHEFIDGPMYTPDWDDLIEPDVKGALAGPWMDGVLHALVMAQIYSGIFPTLGKYNGRSGVYTNGRWFILFSFLCIVPHLFLFLISTYMSGLATVTGTQLHEVMIGSTEHPVMGNYTLLFVNLPAAFNHLGMKHGVTFVFFFMLFIFAVQAQALWAMVAIDNVTDFFRGILKSCAKPCIFLLVSALYCILGLSLGIPLCTRAGLYLVSLIMVWVDKFSFVFTFISCIAFTVSYAKQHYHLANKVVFLIWFVLASLISTAVLLYKSGVLDEPRPFTLPVLYREDYTFPEWGYALGWLIAAGPIAIGLIFGAMHAVASAPGEKCEKCAYACCSGDPDEEYHESRKSRQHKDRQSGEGEEDYLNPKH